MTTHHPRATVTEQQAAVVGVLAQHRRGDWSDNTHACQGCAGRLRDEAEANWPDDLDERRALQQTVNHASKPGWTLAEYDAHLAAVIVAECLPGDAEGGL